MKFVKGDLLDPKTYEEELDGVETVVHLAASTGSAAPGHLERVNVGGTFDLLGACKRKGVRQFLHVSTIAVKYTNQKNAYAQTKAQAEALVSSSGIPHTIIRPTIVLGRNSPAWHIFKRIAKFPIIPLPNGGRVDIQPLHVDELSDGMQLLLSANRFEGEIMELGGPKPIRLIEFVRAVHQCITGKVPHIIPVPLAPIRILLRCVEPWAKPLLPIGSGQLAVFANDGTISPNWLHDMIKDRMRSTDECITELIRTSQ